ncbi:MAG: DUF998 domain-containing protein [Solirubrobacterales bacterium]|nr:DUF998 domain-containing protein [Solirubrobacterales bacterium]MBV9473295.1 DUF998 domain-containing protein [Solirubrobacterales bacterium]
MAGPSFVASLTALGAATEGYDARRQPVSELALGPRGWIQRANFIVTGLLYIGTAAGLSRAPERVVGSRASPLLLAAAGLGLVGSGVFVTDAAEELIARPANGIGPRPSRVGMLHNLCAIPVFVGIPAAASASARAFTQLDERRWAGYSGGSALVMALTFGLSSAAFGQARVLAARAGVLQRASIGAGFGWVTAISLRARRSHLRRRSRPARARRGAGQRR